MRRVYFQLVGGIRLSVIQREVFYTLTTVNGRTCFRLDGLDELLLRHRREVFRAGWRAGYNQGYREGFDAGYEAGFSEGKRLGYNEGRADALCVGEEFVLNLQRFEELLACGEVKVYGPAADETLDVLHKLGEICSAPKP
ncbi:MAG TPA: hypothetical protein EYP63_03440 [Desulfotomaculum sp.]|nr:hypothetical protein [Desulfotomaculum sp.]